MKSVLLPPEGIIFDWDNTLVESWGVIELAWNGVRQHFGLEPWSLDFIKNNTPLRSAREWMVDIFGTNAAAATALYYKIYAENHLQHVRLMPNTSAVIAELASQLPLFVISNKRGLLLRREAELLGLNKYVQAWIGAEDAPRDKPDPIVVTTALAGTGLHPSPRLWFVGDSAADWRCARAAGVTSLLLTQLSPENSTLTPDAWLTDLSELPIMRKRANAAVAGTKI